MPSPIANLSRNQKVAGGILAAIAAALAGVYVNEGGYADHPNDRGGKTMYGITEKVAREEGYRGDMRYFPKHCTTPAMVCADQIYTERYIEDPGFMPFASIEPAILDEIVDTGVVSGPSVSSQFLQASLNSVCDADIVVDKRVGPRTVAAYQSCQRRYGRISACISMLNSMDAMQERFFRGIVARRPSQKVFLNGWLRLRIGNVDRRKCGKGVA